MSTARTTATSVLEVLLVCFVLVLVAGQLLGQPVLIGFVTTGSMQSTLNPGDGFVAVPQALAGPVEAGDVVVFRAEELHGGGLTTHRVVEQTEHGYITKGDNNPFSDQDGVEPPVKQPQIVAQALQIDGQVVVLPHLGDVVVAVQGGIQLVQRRAAILLGTKSLLGPTGFSYLLLVGSVVYYLVSKSREGNSRQREDRLHDRQESSVDAKYIVGLFTLILIVGLTLPMAVPSGAQQYGVVSSDFTSDRPNVIPIGQSKTHERPVVNTGTLPVVVFYSEASDGIEVHPRQFTLVANEQKHIRVTLYAEDETGYYRRYLTEHRYLAILPTPLIQSLYTVHPWLPIVVIDALIGIPFYLFGITLLGKGRIRKRSKNRGLPLTTRIRRLLRAR
ncbi:signal peptidase I [Haloferax sp. YSSS75]|uniref:signal peptidase I n=1 Tax=Haloferax sp. YSSS75 TaxID=3388564 RepID=UPI00398D3FB2